MDKNKTNYHKKRKEFDDLTQRQQKRVKGKFVDKCRQSLLFLGQHNFLATSVTVLNLKTGIYETLNLKENAPSSESKP